MEIFDFLNNKKLKDNAKLKDNTIKNSNNETFVSDIRIVELDKVDWSKFGCLLKQNRILPNSYIKQPSKVEVLVDKISS